jgi:hypothetical protein
MSAALTSHNAKLTSTIEPKGIDCFRCHKAVDISHQPIAKNNKGFCSMRCYRLTHPFTVARTIPKTCYICLQIFARVNFETLERDRHICSRACFHNWLDDGLAKANAAFAQAQKKANHV